MDHIILSIPYGKSTVEEFDVITTVLDQRNFDSVNNIMQCANNVTRIICSTKKTSLDTSREIHK